MLLDLQQRMGRAFHERSADGPESAALLPGLLPLAIAGPAQGLEIYQGAVARALESALQELFPVCLALVGEECFREIARHYDTQRSGAQADLARAGDELPGFLPSLHFLQSVPYLADVAALELARQRSRRHRVVNVLASVEASASELAADPFGWCLVPNASLQRIASGYPVLEIWRAHQCLR